jgi:hypothetical protein
MTFQAYALIVVVPLIALATCALALRRGRPTAGRGWSTHAIEARLRELDGPVSRDSRDGRDSKERRQLQTELTRRGYRQ